MDWHFSRGHDGVCARDAPLMAVHVCRDDQIAGINPSMIRGMFSRFLNRFQCDGGDQTARSNHSVKRKLGEL